MEAHKLTAVVLAAGKSTRTYPLTLTRPKPLLPVANKPIIEYSIDSLKGLVGKIIVVVGYKKEMLINHLTQKYKDMNFEFVEQAEQKGTGHALLQVENKIKGRFIMLQSDDIFHAKDIAGMLRKPNGIMVSESADPSSFGVITESKGLLKNIDEKPEHPKSNLVNTGMYVFSKRIFELLKDIKPSSSGELYLTDAVANLARETKVYVCRARQWLPTSYPWDLLDANASLLASLKKTAIKGKVEKGATINGIVQVGKGTLIKAGAYIEGPVMIGENCIIGPNCFIRSSSTLGNECKVGNAVEIKNSILFDKVCSGHLSYIGDSIIGEKTNIAAGNITANLRHDNRSVLSQVKGGLKDSQRRKLGAIIGDDVHTGINTSFYPGRKIWPSRWTRPGEIVDKDIL